VKKIALILAVLLAACSSDHAAESGGPVVFKGDGGQTSAPFKTTGGVYNLNWKASGPGDCDYEATLLPEMTLLFGAHTYSTGVSPGVAFVQGEGSAIFQPGDHQVRMMTGPSCHWEFTLTRA
jgi:hypothetical protein